MRHWLALGFAVGIFGTLFASQEMDESQGQLHKYWMLLETGDSAGALETAQLALTDMRATRPDSESLESIEDRLQEILDAGRLVVCKLNLIARETNGRTSLFAYRTPSPKELFTRFNRNSAATAATLADLCEKEKVFVNSAFNTALTLNDRAAFDTYRTIVNAGLSGEATSKCRAYLTAYLLAVHDETALPEVLRAAAQYVTDGGLPTFLVEDMVVEIGDARTALRIMDALDAAQWAKWPEGEKARLLKTLAESAAKQGDYGLATAAYGRVLPLVDQTQAEDVHYRIISTYSASAKRVSTLPAGQQSGETVMQEYGAAVAACGAYLESFPGSLRVGRVRYARTVFELLAGDYVQAKKDAQDLRLEYPKSYTAAKLMVVEGLATYKLGRTDEAIRIFLELAGKFPGTPAAARALFLAGQSCLRANKVPEARDCFQRVLDFYPDAPFRKKAEDLLKRYTPGGGAKAP